MPTQSQLPGAWLADLFRYNYCDECGGDIEHHDAIPLILGNWFAQCCYPPNEDGTYHPIIAAYRAARDA